MKKTYFVKPHELDNLIQDLIKDGNTEHFKIIRDSSEHTLITNTSIYKAKICENTDFKILSEIKHGQEEIIKNLHFLKQEAVFFGSKTASEKIELLQKQPRPEYTQTKKMDSDIRQVVQIDIKSAYIETAYKLGFIPTSLYKHINELPTKLQEKYSEEEAKKIAKKIRLILLGSLAKKQSESVYLQKKDWIEYEDTGEVKEITGYNIKQKAPIRIKGQEVSNIYFVTANALCNAVQSIFKKIENCYFYWVDALFCSPENVQEVCEELDALKYKYKVYEPQPAYFENNTWRVGEGADQKPYFFAKNSVTNTAFNMLKEALEKANHSAKSIKKVYRAAQTQELWELATKKLIRAGINPNEFFNIAFELKNESGKKETVYKLISDFSISQMLEEVAERNFWENPNGTGGTWEVTKKRLTYK